MTERFTFVYFAQGEFNFGWGLRGDIGAVTYAINVELWLDNNNRDVVSDLLGEFIYHGYVPERPGHYPIDDPCKALADGRTCYPTLEYDRSNAMLHAAIKSQNEAFIWTELERRYDIWVRNHKQESEG